MIKGINSYLVNQKEILNIFLITAEYIFNENMDLRK